MGRGAARRRFSKAPKTQWRSYGSTNCISAQLPEDLGLQSTSAGDPDTNVKSGSCQPWGLGRVEISQNCSEPPVQKDSSQENGFFKEYSLWHYFPAVIPQTLPITSLQEFSNPALESRIFGGHGRKESLYIQPQERSQLENGEKVFSKPMSAINGLAWLLTGVFKCYCHILSQQ